MNKGEALKTLAALLGAIMLLVSTMVASAERRVALVVGNSDYLYGRLSRCKSILN